MSMTIVSSFGGGNSFIPKSGIDTGLGRTYYRHPTEPGTVISWWDVGTEQQIDLLVFDAARRALSKYWDKRISGWPDASLPNLRSQNINVNWYIDGNPTPPEDAISAAANLSEAQLNTLWPASVIDPNTAKHNCSVWESMDLTNYPALAHARTVLTADGQKADIPNIQELMRIFCMAAIIDSLDPTVADYPSLALTVWNGHSWVWASSEYSNTLMRTVAGNGNCGNISKQTTRAVLPVLELNLAA